MPKKARKHRALTSCGRLKKGWRFKRGGAIVSGKKKKKKRR